MLEIFNTFCLVLGYITLSYLLLCTITFIWLFDAFKQQMLVHCDDGKVPMADYIDSFVTCPVYAVCEIVIIIKEMKNERNNKK